MYYKIHLGIFSHQPWKQTKGYGDIAKTIKGLINTFIKIDDEI